MAYRVRPTSDSSDSQSDEEVFWKKTPVAGQKRPSGQLHQNSHKPAKRSRNNIWLNVARDCELSEIISQTHTYEIRDNSRGPENYLVFSDEDGEVDKLDSTPSEVRSFPKDTPALRLEDAISIENIGVDYESPPELVKETLARLLNEPNVDLLENVIRAIGVKRSLQFYFLTESVESAGGIYLADGSRRRTKGGVFLHLLRRSAEITKEEKNSAFKETRQMRDKFKRKRKQVKKQIEKLMQNSADCSSKMRSNPNSTSECAQREVKEEATHRPQEMEEGELPSSDENNC
ncbi:Phosphorylated adapter RNA export protein [Fasciolopsis buskii]|uniref:Phosphorylated adapter RNA export protein n=1 Tax=Fasciolopsis buskii TaxID=27845 RepID=A0A8E0VLS7_9TREM|nr:Phosphorylated adapter RNA export protein [Fasciolopsis buski]